MRLPCIIVEDPFDIDFSACRVNGEIVVWGISLVPASGTPVDFPEWLHTSLREFVENHPDLEEMLEWSSKLAVHPFGTV